MSSSPPPKASASAKSPAPASIQSTVTDAYKTGYTAAAAAISPSSSRAPTMTMASPALPRSLPSNLSSAPSYFSEKHHPEDHIIEILDAPPVGSSHDPLVLFHSALGIPPPKPQKVVKPTKKNPNPPPPPPKPKLTAANKGVYHLVLQMERRTRFKYYFCDSIVTIAMFLQIIVGASVTAFGAGSASHILITAFGAANTALASLLAVLKSQGLPNRIRQDWNEWRELREYIEEKEREIEMVFAGRIGDGTQVELKDVWEMVKGIERRYNLVRLTCEANRPDTYIKVPPVAGLPK